MAHFAFSQLSVFNEAEKVYIVSNTRKTILPAVFLFLLLKVIMLEVFRCLRTYRLEFEYYRLTVPVICYLTNMFIGPRNFDKNHDHIHHRYFYHIFVYVYVYVSLNQVSFGPYAST